jgi:hypothetical protein
MHHETVVKGGICRRHVLFDASTAPLPRTDFSYVDVTNLTLDDIRARAAAARARTQVPRDVIVTAHEEV